MSDRLTTREDNIMFARVMLAEFRVRSHSWVNRRFIWTLFDAAQRARRKAAKADREPAQAGMF